jgi:sulfur carrier protein ThiS
MKNVVINGKSYTVETNTPLKKLLTQLGFAFPCGGEGRCGRCKISCKEIKATSLDGKFLNEKQLVSGIRLACDKLIDSDYDISIDSELFGVQENVKKLSECRISVSIGIQEVAISILDDEIVETVIRPNPLFSYGLFTSLSKKYSSDRPTFSKMLRNVIGKESVELFEKYGTAKADTLAIAGSEFYIKILLGVPLNQEITDYSAVIENDNLSLPTEQIYILPMVNQYFGGDLLCETMELKENSLLINCEDVCSFAYIGKEDNKIAAMWDITYKENIELNGIKAAILTLIKDNIKPLVYLYGKNIDCVASIVEELDLTHIDNMTKRIENIAKACLFSRFRAKLNKEKARSSYFDIVNSEDFHNFFAKSYTNY